MYMLDTNIASDAIRGNPPLVRLRMMTLAHRDLCISAITHAELLHGARSLASGERRAALCHHVEQFAASVGVVPWNAADAYADLLVGLRRNAIALAGFDALIAAHARSLGAVLVTRDRAFSQVPDLTVENWATE